MEPPHLITQNSDDLVFRAVEGDAESLMTVLRSVGPQVARKLKVSDVYRSSLDADDVMQVAYLEAFLRIGDLQIATLPGFIAWLTRIAENSLLDAIKGLTRQRRPPPWKQIRSTAERSSSIELLETLGWCSATPSRQAATQEAGTLLQRALPMLPESYEQVVRLLDLEMLAPQEVARQMGRSVGAIHMLHARALRRLAEIIGPESNFFSHSA